MSKRSIKKRRHRTDFQGYMHHREVDRIGGGPMWKRAGFPTHEAYLKYLESKPKDGPVFHSQPHVHGPDCNHYADVHPVPGTALSQSEADTMTDGQWIEEPRLTAEEAAAFAAADNEEGEPF